MKELIKTLCIDCNQCCGLCCVSLYYSKTDGFPTNKDSGVPCDNLLPDFKCKIHAELMNKKLFGCIHYDCFGAGQKVTQKIYQGKSWRNIDNREEMFSVFNIVFHLHQMLWYLIEASNYIQDEKIELLIKENERMTSLSPKQILNLDIEKYRNSVNAILKNVVASISSTSQQKTGDYIGKNFKDKNLDGVDFSMALLIASNFEGCSLEKTSFLGADMRNAIIKNADLSKSAFLTQMQINSAIGNRNTKLPKNIAYPTYFLN